MQFPWNNHRLEFGMLDPLGLRRLYIDVHERATHLYVIGTTGKGKSKFLEHLLFQDILAGRGCGLLDPHGDLACDLLAYLESHPRQAAAHWDRIMYFDPADPTHVLPFNVLAGPGSPYEITQNVIEAFRRTWPHSLREAPRMVNLATAGLLTLIAHRLTLVELPRLLMDREFRERLVERLDDPQLVAFWTGQYAAWGREQPRMIESLLNKVMAFTLNPHLRLMLGAAENRLDLGRIMDEGKVLLVNLGHCDAETRRLVGSLIVTGLEQAARARRQSPSRRRPFYFAMDEFQDFCVHDDATQSLAQILSECRKYGLHLTLAHQTLAQVGERMHGALGNIQLKAVFGVARRDAEVLAKHLFQVDSEQIKHGLTDAERASHPLYYSLHEEWEKAIQRLQNLAPRQALVKRPACRGVQQLRTKTVRYTQHAGARMENRRRELARTVGCARSQIAAQIAARAAHLRPMPPILREPVRELV